MCSRNNESSRASSRCSGNSACFVRSAAKFSVASVMDEVVQFIQERTLTGSIRIQRMARKQGQRLVRAWGSRFLFETGVPLIEAWIRGVWGRQFARQLRAELTHLQVPCRSLACKVLR